MCRFKQILEAAPTKQMYGHLPPIEHDMQGTAREERTNSQAMFSHGLLYLDSAVLADQQSLTYIGSVWTHDAV